MNCTMLVLGLYGASLAGASVAAGTLTHEPPGVPDHPMPVPGRTDRPAPPRMPGPPTPSYQLFGKTERGWRLRTVAPPPAPAEVRALESVDPAVMRAELYKPRDASAQARLLEALQALDALTLGAGSRSFRIGLNHTTWQTETHGALQVAYFYHAEPRGTSELPFCRLVYLREQIESGAVAIAPLNNWCAQAIGVYARGARAR